MILIDSSIWVSVIHESDSLHENGLNMMDVVDKKDIAIFDYTYAEVLNVLRQKGMPACLRFLKLLKEMHLGIFLSDESQMILANRLFLNDDKKLSFTDCLLIATGIINNAQLLTFDKDLKKTWESSAGNNKSIEE